MQRYNYQLGTADFDFQLLHACNGLVMQWPQTKMGTVYRQTKKQGEMFIYLYQQVFPWNAKAPPKMKDQKQPKIPKKN